MAIIPKVEQNDNIDFEPVNFGKYKERGLTPEQIALEDGQYIVWAFKEYGNKFCSKALYVDCLKEIQDIDEINL